MTVSMSFVASPDGTNVAVVPSGRPAIDSVTKDVVVLPVTKAVYEAALPTTTDCNVGETLRLKAGSGWGTGAVVPVSILTAKASNPPRDPATSVPGKSPEVVAPVTYARPTSSIDIAIAPSQPSPPTN